MWISILYICNLYINYTLWLKIFKWNALIQYNLIKNIQPQDLNKFGLIPEFVGRLPITVALHDLSEEALVKIMTAPKNSITKQYKKMFDMDA